MARPLDPAPFLDQRRYLEYPGPESVGDALACLPRRGVLEVLCRWGARSEIAAVLEGAGAFAIRIEPLPGFVEVRITAWKGKAGSCHETGRTATYHGAARAVLDDDHHLIAGSIRVCEKTGGLYTLPPYHGLLSVTDGEDGLIRRLDSDPVPFDCDTFEEDAARLTISFPPARAGATEGGEREGDGLRSVFYPGPFRRLIVADGSILRRGVPARIPSRLAPELEARDGLLLIPERLEGEAEVPASLPVLYPALGAGCLLDGMAAATRPEGRGEPDGDLPAVPPRGWLVLEAAPAEIKGRLARLIERGEPYFILTGSDPRESGGCCPSTMVGAANGLVEDGVLASYRTPAPPDACTTTVYAFAGEIRLVDGRPRFALRPEIRGKAARILRRAPLSPA